MDGSHHLAKCAKRLRHALLIAVSTAIATASSAQDARLRRTSPEAQGVPSETVAAFLDSVMSTPDAELHHVMLLRHGAVIGEAHPSPFRAEDGHTLFSCSKTFAAAAVGMAVEENRLRLTDRVAAFFPGELPDDIPPRLADLTVYDLLTMRSGFAPTDSVRVHCDAWVGECLKRRQTADPGSLFAYDSMDTYLLSAIISRVAGVPLAEYLRPRLFEPLGIREAVWESSPEGVSCGGWGLYLTAESMAKFGQCLLNGGLFEGRRVLTESWVRNMMSVHVAEKGYGLQMWSCAHPNTMRADGAYGQFIIVMPDEDMVCVITQCITSAAPGNREQRMLFRIVVPALSEGPLPKTRKSERLVARHAGYTTRTAPGRSSSAILTDGSAITLRLPVNRLGWQSITLSPNGKTLTATVIDSLSRIVPIELANGGWTRGQVPTTFPPHPKGFTRGAYSGFTRPFVVAGSYGWTGRKTLNLRLLFADWISGIEMTIHFDAAKSAEISAKCNFDRSPFAMRASVEP